MSATVDTWLKLPRVMFKGLFLDRDGTIILDKHYLADPAGVEIIPGSAEALIRARELGYKLFLFTNQSGIGRGHYTLDDTLRVNARMLEMLELPESIFDEICIAPETPDQIQVYRKPSPRFILETISKYSLDAMRCYMIGDNMADIDAARNAKIHPIAVCTGKHTAEGWKQKLPAGAAIFPRLLDFIQTLD